MKRLNFTLFACLIAAMPLLVSAQDTARNVRPWDTRLNPDWVSENIIGQSVTLIDGGTASYGADGSYSYVYKGGNTFTGTYVMTQDGAICVTFENGAERCDLYVKQGEKLMLITQDGGRYPQAE